MKLMAKSDNGTYIIKEEYAEQIKNSKMSEENQKFIQEKAELFRKNNLKEVK